MHSHTRCFLCLYTFPPAAAYPVPRDLSHAVVRTARACTSGHHLSACSHLHAGYAATLLTSNATDSAVAAARSSEVKQTK